MAQEESRLNTDSFWQIAALAEERVGLMADVIVETPQLGEHMLQELMLLAQEIEKKPDTVEEVKDKMAQTISAWSERSERSAVKEPPRPERNPWRVDIETLAMAKIEQPGLDELFELGSKPPLK